MSLKQPLLPSVELSNRIDIITMEDLNRQHEAYLNNGGCIQSNKLVEILGGADAVLSHYLSTNNLSSLTTLQLQKIDALLNHSDHHLIGNKENTKIESPILLASNTNTILHHIIKRDIADKVRQFIFNRITTAIVAIAWVICALISAVLVKYYQYSYYLLLFLCCLLLTHMFLLLLMLNKRITTLIAHTFEFWFKMVHLIRFIIGDFLIAGKCHHYDDVTGIGAYTWISVRSIAGMMIVLLFCLLLDGLKMPLRIKIAVLMLWSITYTIIAVQFAFLTKETCTVSFFNLFTLDIVSLMGGSLRILAIFAWKQTFYSMFKAPKSAVIIKSVKVTWL